MKPFRKPPGQIKRLLYKIGETTGKLIGNDQSLTALKKGTSSVTSNIGHTALDDMPSSTNSDHDGRYRTETELASVANGEGASLIGVEDSGGLYTATDVEAALAEVAGDVAALTPVWDRTGTVLSPATAGDTVELEQTSTTGSALSVTRDLASGSTNAPVVSIVQDNAGDDQYAHSVRQDGATSALHASSTYTGGALTDAISAEILSVADGSRAIIGSAKGATGETVGVYGESTSADNAAYGGSFDRTRLGTWGDVAESATAPLATAPPAGYVRITASTDGRLYAFDSDGNRHDLNDITPHFFPGWVAAQNSASGSTWDDEKYPSGAMAIATVTASQNAAFDFTNEGGRSSYGRWTWSANAVNAGGWLYLNQSQVAVWTPFSRQGDPNDNCRVYVQARIRVNKVANFDNVYLVINDVTTADAFANTAKSADQLGSMSDNTWYIATLSATGTDVGGWNEALRAGVWVQGATETAFEEETISFDVDWIKVYMFAN